MMSNFRNNVIMVILAAFVLFLQGCSSLPRDNYGGNAMQQALFQAVSERDSDTVRRIIRDGADLDSQDAKGRTALMIATYHNDVETAKALIEAGADVNMQDEMGNSPFLYAGAEGYLDILKLTIKGGANPAITNRYGGTALIPASEHGYVEVVQELLTRTTVDVNQAHMTSPTGRFTTIT